MAFINEIKAIRPTMLPALLLLGDFNLLCKAADKSNATISRRLINAFTSALNSMELSDLRLHGRRFTWVSSCQLQTKTKIDHVFCTLDWGLLFPQCYLRALSSSVSDHCAMVLTGQINHRRFRGFRFENYWLKMRGFDDAIILGLDHAQDHTDLTIAEIGLRHYLKRKLLGLAAIQRIRIRQRSRVLWLRAGDANSRLFHIKANGRRRRNYIPLLQTDHGQFTTQADKHAELHKHFSVTIGSVRARNQSLNWDALDLPRLDLSSLDAPFTEEEIKAAVFGLPSGKAPGPDGFTADFFKHCWEVIKHDLTVAICQFFNLRGNHWHMLNSAHITLLPKSNEASRIKEFRPISLMHSVGKIVCKMLSIRLAPFLSVLIPPSQSAFLKTRSIHDNFLFVKNAVRKLHSVNDPALLLKLDIAGAFDNVSWSYMLELMPRLGFGSRWCDMVLLLWSSSPSRVMANGELGQPFSHRCGLRQEHHQGADIQPILDKLASKLQRWRGKLMSGDARLRLINSVLSAIPVYLITIFKLGAWAIKQIDKLRRNFLWHSRPEADKGIALVNWSTVCRPKYLGGLGVIDLKQFGRALRLRWKWLEWRDQNRPWVGSPTPCDRDDEALFAAATNITMGNGSRARFWQDRWLHGEAPCQLAPDVFRLCYRKNFSVAQGLADQRWLSGLHRISTEPELRQFTFLWTKLRHFVLDPNREDSISWNRTVSTTYTARSAYHAQFLGSAPVANYDKLWKAKVEGRCRFFFWLFLKGKILTNDNLARRALPHNPRCNLCDQEEESAFHLILQCPFARSVWHLVENFHSAPGLATAAMHATSIISWWNDVICPLGKKTTTTAIYTCWNIWKERNRRVFEHKTLAEQGVLLLINQEILQPMLSSHCLSDVEN
nr:uncharacterized protein LOC120969066 [Aegilops tauschii subsp. strangulata]